MAGRLVAYRLAIDSGHHAQEARMHRAPLVRITLATSAALLLGCESHRPLEPSRRRPDLARGTPAPAARVRHPDHACRRSAEGCMALRRTPCSSPGGIIAGYSWHRDGRMIPVTWTLQNGAWTITALPYAADRHERSREGRSTIMATSPATTGRAPLLTRCCGLRPEASRCSAATTSWGRQSQ